MKGKYLLLKLLLLIALNLTAYSSYGQRRQDSTNRFAIAQSTKCFYEVKYWRMKDSITAIKLLYLQQDKLNYKILADTLQYDNIRLSVFNEKLVTKNASHKTTIRWLWIAVIGEAIVIVLLKL
jgi:SPX domain protein involved in polyphosphate accumulation